MTAPARKLDHRTEPALAEASAIAASYRWYETPGPDRAGSPDNRGKRGTVVLDGPGRVGIRSAGVDLADERRMRTAVARRGQDIIRRIFTESERAEMSADAQARFAELTAMFGVKESVVKLLGGLPHGSRYQDIVVSPLTPGRVSSVRLRGVLAGWADEREVVLVAAAVPVAEHLALAWAAALTAGSLR
jgi:phosphopantetheine--protein transferase-like protein